MVIQQHSLTCHVTGNTTDAESLLGRWFETKRTPLQSVSLLIQREVTVVLNIDPKRLQRTANVRYWRANTRRIRESNIGPFWQQPKRNGVIVRSKVGVQGVGLCWMLTAACRRWITKRSGRRKHFLHRRHHLCVHRSYQCWVFLAVGSLLWM